MKLKEAYESHSKSSGYSGFAQANALSHIGVGEEVLRGRVFSTPKHATLEDLKETLPTELVWPKKR
ncbi:MAG: hypothetical protein KKF67_00985 [Nanoarchaeota archaeon]|nr:hypothetical protein [Nanoarchaeota archaeon]